MYEEGKLNCRTMFLKISGGTKSAEFSLLSAKKATKKDVRRGRHECGTVRVLKTKKFSNMINLQEI